MAKYVKPESKKIGTAPGSLIFVGRQKIDQARIDVISYSADSFELDEKVSVSQLRGYLNEDKTVWINVTGLHDTELIGAIGETFQVHPLIVEDVLNTDQRTKIEEIEGYMAFFCKMVKFNEAEENLEEEQLSMLLGKGVLITFQEAGGDVFNSVRERLNRATTKIRVRGADYLAFALLDAVVDHQFLSIEAVGDRIERITENLQEDPDEQIHAELNECKRLINRMRRIVRPMIEVSNTFEKSESLLVQKNTIPFIKDLEDHVLQSAESIEIYKELINDELANYHAVMGAKLNDIIRVLTIFSVVFIPLTFLAGIYGTNFQYLPELEYKYAYPIFWVVLIVVAALMLYFFKKKKWLQ
jgi:magnesium transporter